MAFTSARDSKEVKECDSLVIDIPSDPPPLEREECCIYRVPKQLRKVNEEAYTPKLLSVGPFHHIHPKEDFKDDMAKYKLHLKGMEKHKLKYLDDFVNRTEKSQADLLKIIKRNEVKISHSYSEDFELKSDEFVQMILLDAIFIIELFLKTSKKEPDYILSKPWLKYGILHDLILLENQLPFFILEELYMFALDDSSCCNNLKEGQQIEEHQEAIKNEDSPFVKLSRNYFGWYDKDKDKELKSISDEEVTGEPSDEKVTGKPIGKEVKHFTDLLRYLLCPPNMEQYQEEESSCTGFWQFCSPKKPKEGSFGTRYCATKLDDAGLKFKEAEGRRLLDIPHPGVLRRFPCFGRPMEVPRLVINDYTESLLRNLMALEQCHYPPQTYICNYVALLDSLIDTEKDVDLLVHEKVIVNELGSNKIVADLINKLRDNILVTQSSYSDYIGRKLDEHYEYHLNHTMATLKREYFPNVFRGTATVVGLIVLGFTLWNFIRPFVV